MVLNVELGINFLLGIEQKIVVHGIQHLLDFNDNSENVRRIEVTRIEDLRVDFIEEKGQNVDNRVNLV